MGRSREKAIAFVGICVVAVVVVLKNVSILYSRGSLVQGRREQPVEKARAVAKVTKVAICILTRRDAWRRRHLLRQTWLQDVPHGAQVSHIFVMGEDRSYTPEESSRLAAEVEAHGDILIAPAEEAGETMAARTKHCIYWTTRNHDFDVLVKTNDDSTLFLSRLFGEKGWLPPHAVSRDELLYFGKRHALSKVPNPANFLPDPATKSDLRPAGLPDPAGAAAATGVDGQFEFDYRGVYWPEHMEGGMYGLSRGLAEEIVKNDFRTYSSEEATVGVWVSAFRARAAYLADEQVLSSEADYLSSNGTAVAASFRTCRLRLASMWCEYAPLGKLSPRSILAKDVQQTLDCLGSYERASHTPRSLPLGTRDGHRTATLESINRKWPITKRPNHDETGDWWAQMSGAFRGAPAAVVGTSATTVDRMPLYLLQGMHTLVLDDFFRVSERYTSWAPTMYMCVDPDLCASPDGGGSSGGARGGGRTRGRGGGGRRGGAAATVESANRFARDVFAAFYVLSGGIDGAEYWRYLRQRVNAHWFVAGVGDEEGGGAAAAGMVQAEGERRVAGKSPENFRVLARTSGLAMSVEVLSYLGFSPIYVTAANEELAEAQQWDEFSRAVRTASSAFGTKVVYLYAGEDDKLPKSRVVPQPAWRSGSGADKAVAEAVAAGKLSSQEDILAFAKARSYARGERSARWDLEIFLQHFPVVSRLEIVRGASSVEGMFPRSPGCRRDADDLDRFQKAVLCPVKISLKHFSSFLSWHVPYGPVRGTFVWVKR
ncbi:unnamed protein product [Scytosiphon promiscuus]